MKTNSVLKRPTFRKKLLPGLIIFSLAIYFFPSTLGSSKTLHLFSYSSEVSQGEQSSYRLVQYPLPNGSSAPYSITVDNSGNVWFVEQGSNQIGSLDPASGVIKEYSIPTPNSSATTIAADSSRNIWFSELDSNRLGELKNGSIIEFDVPSSVVDLEGTPTIQQCGPTEVAPDNLGHIWVICIFSNQIDEFFPNVKTFESFDLPVFLSGPAGLVFDNSGDFWFTAADAGMIGRGIISQLRNESSSGITEFAPINQTYVYSFQESTNYLGSTRIVKSSLPTPTGIALSPDGNTLWITEHVDSSFDSFNIKTDSLDRFWTSNTEDAYGYPVSLPNGVAVTVNGTVWIAEHYGNKIAEFNPYLGKLIEYLVPCCKSSIAGVYTLHLGLNGIVWFVEIQGNAIGELLPVANRIPMITIGLEPQLLIEKSPSSAQVSLKIIQDAISNQSDSINLDLSGISDTGSPAGLSATFEPSSLQLSGTHNVTSQMDLNVQSLRPGIYDLTLGARVPSYGVIYSTIIKLEISSPQNAIFIYTIILVVVAVTIFVSYIGMIKSKRQLLRDKC